MNWFKSGSPHPLKPGPSAVTPASSRRDGRRDRALTREDGSPWSGHMTPSVKGLQTKCVFMLCSLWLEWKLWIKGVAMGGRHCPSQV